MLKSFCCNACCHCADTPRKFEGLPPSHADPERGHGRHLGVPPCIPLAERSELSHAARLHAWHVLHETDPLVCGELLRLRRCAKLNYARRAATAFRCRIICADSSQREAFVALGAPAVWSLRSPQARPCSAGWRLRRGACPHVTGKGRRLRGMGGASSPGPRASSSARGSNAAAGAAPPLDSPPITLRVWLILYLTALVATAAGGLLLQRWEAAPGHPHRSARWMPIEVSMWALCA
jgi:hypothetical protein